MRRDLSSIFGGNAKYFNGFRFKYIFMILNIHLFKSPWETLLGQCIPDIPKFTHRWISMCYFAANIARSWKTTSVTSELVKMKYFWTIVNKILAAMPSN